MKPTILTLSILVLVLPALAQSPSTEDRVAKLKATLTASEAALKQYEWVETTVVNVDGEEKSRQMDRCYYGADGKLQQLPLTAPAAEPERRGLRGRIAERKKEELTDYMKEAVALVKHYVPPKPALIQSAKERGNVSVDILEPGKRVRMNFRDYLKPGDNLGIEVDLTNDHLVGLTVNTQMDSAKDAVNLTARFAELNDGTTYPNTATLDAPAKKLQIQVENSGYKKNN